MNVCRMASARAKAEQAQQSAIKAQSDADKGRQKAYGYDPNFVQPGAYLRLRLGFCLLLHCSNTFVYVCVYCALCYRDDAVMCNR